MPVSHSYWLHFLGLHCHPLTSEKHVFAVLAVFVPKKGNKCSFLCLPFWGEGGMLMTTKHISTVELGTVVPMSSISFHSHMTLQTTSWPQEDIISPGLPAEKSKCRDVITKVTHFRAGLCSKKSHAQVHRKRTVHLFALELKRIFSRRQQTLLVSLKYLELESVRGYCQPFQYFRIPRLGIFLLHC